MLRISKEVYRIKSPRSLSFIPSFILNKRSSIFNLGILTEIRKRLMNLIKYIFFLDMYIVFWNILCRRIVVYFINISIFLQNNKTCLDRGSLGQ